MSRILVLQGPNLNLLGSREPDQYGHQTLEDIHRQLDGQASAAGVDLNCFQSNAEGELVTKIQESAGKVDFIVINPAAFTHTSVAIRDAFLAVKIPFVEVHISNVFSREAFRHHSFLSDIAVGVMSGFGASGYEFALSYAIQYLTP